jgi:hypothetical protein
VCVLGVGKGGREMTSVGELTTYPCNSYFTTEDDEGGSDDGSNGIYKMRKAFLLSLWMNGIIGMGDEINILFYFISFLCSLSLKRL